MIKSFFGLDVHSSTLGIIGMGRIGEAIARRAKFGFNMNVLYYNRNRKPEAEEKFGLEYSDMESLLTKSDFHCFNDTTTQMKHFHLIGGKGI